MKKIRLIYLSFFVVLISMACLISSQIHPPPQILVEINGYDMTLFEASENDYLVEGATLPTSSLTTILSIGHNFDEVWVSVDGVEGTLQDAINHAGSFTNGLCALTSPTTTGYNSFNLNPGHVATEVTFPSPWNTFQVAIDDGIFCATGCSAGWNDCNEDGTCECDLSANQCDSGSCVSLSTCICDWWECWDICQGQTFINSCGATCMGCNTWCGIGSWNPFF